MIPILDRARSTLSFAVSFTLFLALTLGASQADAKSHLWRFTEFFSNAAGNIQFVEMFVFDPAGTAEIQFGGQPLTSNANTFIFPNHLPNENTFERWVLIATPDFASLPGAPVPDYILPANFFDPAGDEIRYRNTIDVFTIAPGEMPTNGIQSLLRDHSAAINSPTNFAGDTGSVVAAPAVPGLGPGIALLGGIVIGSIGLLGRSWTNRSRASTAHPDGSSDPSSSAH